MKSELRIKILKEVTKAKNINKMSKDYSNAYSYELRQLLSKQNKKIDFYKGLIRCL